MDEFKTIAKKSQWEPVTSQSLSDVAFTPSAIADYSSAKKPDHYLALLVRKQLLLLDWKIEHIDTTRKSVRYRYTSPNDGKIYHSLRFVCNDIINSSSISFDSVKIFPRKRKIRVNNDDLDNYGHDQSSNPLLSDSTVLKSEDVEKSWNKLKLKRNKFGSGTLCSLTDNDVVAAGEKERYSESKSRNRLKEGRITRNGIECSCCRRILAPKFEAHAGSTNHRPPANIIAEDGRSSSDSQRQLASESENQNLNLPKTNPRNMLRNKRKAKMLKQNAENKKKRGNNNNNNKKEQNQKVSDYLCSVCRQEGDLLFCDDCPSAFHQICLAMKDVPIGHWSCPLCCCDHCGCRKYNDSFVRKDGYVLRCEQCPFKIHVGCAKDRGMNCERDINPGWFCSDKCRSIYLNVQNLLGQSIVIGKDNLTWTLLRRWHKNSGNNKLNLALKLIHECFDPVTEYYTGKDLVEDVVFSRTSQLPRLNFRRFFTILMEKNNDPVAVANLRISGDKVAEVPLVATKFEYRRLGMCRKLMDELEKQLIQLGVEKLVLPSATTTLQTWTDGFGFSQMTDADRKHYFLYSFLDFKGTIMCHKLLAKI